MPDPLNIGVVKSVYIKQNETTFKYSRDVIITIENGKISSEVIIKPVIVAIAKLEANYIKEWINYHRKLGFDKIYLYDNEDTPFYEKFLNSEFVDVTHLPGNNYSKPVQYTALEHFINNKLHSKDITHVIHIDIDEFIALKKHDNIKHFIREYITGDTAGIGINWRHFGDSGKTVPSYEPVTQRFISCELNGNKTIKTLFDK
jgi:hypothetical protein